MMSSSDLMVEGFPHGTPQGYEAGCRGSVCPAGDEYGLSCKTALQKSRGDYQYQRLAKSGASVAEIADALGLVGTAPAAPKPKATPATAKGGRALADKVAPAPAPVVTPEPETPTTYQEAPDAAQGEAEALVTPEPETVAADRTAPAEERPAPKPGEIRAWAIAKGYDVGATGKLPKIVVDHYWDATGRLTVSEPAPVEAPAPELPAAIAEHVAQLEEELTGKPIPEQEPAERPEWSTVAAHADVEAARNLAVRLEQELARSEEQRATDKTQHAASLRAADDVIGGVLEALGKGPDHDPILAASAAAKKAAQLVNEVAKRIELEELLTRRTKERDAAETRARTAEQAVQLALTKWGEERAANEVSTALIHNQARTINTLTDLIGAPVITGL